MVTCFYTKKETKTLRCAFRIEAGDIILPGAIFQSKTGYHWKFAQKSPSEARGFLPFKFMYHGLDCSQILFYGLPQALLSHVLGYTPANIQFYEAGSNRTCATCQFAQYHTQNWADFLELDWRDQRDNLPKHLYSCMVNESWIDEAAPTKTWDYYKKLKESLKSNSCKAHTRKAFKTQNSMEARDQGAEAESWVSNEIVRLGVLNPAAWEIKADVLYLPGNLAIKLIEE